MPLPLGVSLLYSWEVMDHYTQRDDPEMDDDENGVITGQTGPSLESDPEDVESLESEHLEDLKKRRPERESRDDVPDLAYYLGQFGMARKDQIALCRTHANYLSRQESFAQKKAVGRWFGAETVGFSADSVSAKKRPRSGNE